jgi:hypothetical protein
MKPVQEFIDNLDQKWQQETCQQLLELQFEAEPNLDAAIKWQNPYFSYNGKALLKWYCATSWINVYFYNGYLLKSDLFEKSDNERMRTIKLYQNTQLDTTVFKELLGEAAKLNS